MLRAALPGTVCLEARAAECPRSSKFRHLPCHAEVIRAQDFDDSEVVAKLPCALLDFGLSSWMRSWLWFWWWFADVVSVMQHLHGLRKS